MVCQETRVLFKKSSSYSEAIKSMIKYCTFIICGVDESREKP
jgi:hypothetical protein